MYVDNENGFLVYLSLYSDDPHWRFWFHHTNEFARLPVGVIVFYFLNRINRMKDDGQMDLSKHFIHITEDTDYTIYDTETWRTCYDELIAILDHLSEMSVSEKHRAYKIYCQSLPLSRRYKGACISIKSL